jgi:integrase
MAGSGLHVYQHGSPLRPDLLTQEFKRIVRRHNLPDMKFHGLRHAFASLALSVEVPAKVVPEAVH